METTFRLFTKVTCQQHALFHLSPHPTQLFKFANHKCKEREPNLYSSKPNETRFKTRVFISVRGPVVVGKEWRLEREKQRGREVVSNVQHP